ncbi:MAG: DUF1298 domain-containing protein [Thermoleophilaceae bacterium]|nr:DUF1298 domain-containing protein [Thermoleophilaceae bacterium]
MREPLGPEDAQILALEHGPIAGHTMKIAVLERPVSVEQVCARLEERLGPVMRRRLAPGDGAPAWEEDPVFEVTKQVRAAEGGGLEVLAGMLMGERLPRDRPLWCIDVAVLADGRGALFWRVHHALADGTAVMRLGDEMLWDQAPDALVSGRTRPAGKPDNAKVRSVVRELRPSHEIRALAAPVGKERAVAFASSSIARLKAAEHAAGAGPTVNDVVLAVTAGAIRRWLECRHERVHDVRVKVPVSMHTPGELPHAVANRDSCLFVDLPVGERDPLERIRLVSAETSARKAAHDADALYVLMHGDSPISRIAQKLASDPHEFAVEISNVPGPRTPRSFLGRPVQAFFTLAEIGRRHALRVAAVSLAEDMHIGLCVDAQAIPDVGALGEGLAAELGELPAAALGG